MGLVILSAAKDLLFRRVSVLALLGVWLCSPAGAEQPDELKATGYVNDFAGVIDAQTEAQLTALCAELEQKTRAQIAVVTIRSLEGLTVEDFAIQLATRWGVGHKGDDNGVLILLAVEDRKYRIEVGYGLEPILPDGKVGGFGREMVPLLRQGDHGGALLHLTSRIADIIATDRGVTLGTKPSQPPLPHSDSEPFPTATLIFLLVVFGIVVASVVNAIRRGFSGAWMSRGGNEGSWTGSSWGGGGGGFGGFSGGSFGGGGASGSW